MMNADAGTAGLNQYSFRCLQSCHKVFVCLCSTLTQISGECVCNLCVYACPSQSMHQLRPTKAAAATVNIE